eukprot:2632146-Rhodomonas_salina.1
MNICTLAKYGNGGTIVDVPSTTCGGYSLRGAAKQVHWYGNCRKGRSSEASCCSNAELLQSGFDWNKFAKGNKCRGDSDTDRVLGKVECDFGPPPPPGYNSNGAWPLTWCHPMNAACTALGVLDN